MITGAQSAPTGNVQFGKRELRKAPLPPPVYWNHRVRGKSRNNLWGTITCGQNLDVKELTSGILQIDSQHGYECDAAHRLGLDDDRRLGIWGARLDVTWRSGKEVEFGNASWRVGVSVRLTKPGLYTWNPAVSSSSRSFANWLQPQRGLR